MRSATHGRGVMASAAILGVDQGTTGTRACLMDEAGRVQGDAYLTHRQIHPRPGWVEHDPDEIWTNTRRVIERALAAAPAVRPVAIALANQGETVLLWNRSTGRPLGPA